MPGESKPFLWFSQNTNDRAGMWISYFPEGEADVGLQIDKSIKMTVQAASYVDLADLEAPAQPATASDPETINGIYLQVSALSSALLLLTIF